MVLSNVQKYSENKCYGIYNSRNPRIKPKLAPLPEKKLTPLIRQVQHTIEEHRLFVQSDRILIAVSGGSDSVGLLHILAKITSSANLIAVYIDHGLRPDETLKERELIGLHCKKLGVHFEHHKVDVRKYVLRHNMSIEDGARTLRYSALEKKRKEYNAECIAVGHTANDQVEEFFIRLIRGTGMKGLSGMQFKRGNIIRPLLFLKKTRIERFLIENDIRWAIDSSNMDRTFLRNRIRHELIPFLQNNFSPSIGRTVIQTLEILKEDEKLLSELSLAAYADCVSKTEPFHGDNQVSKKDEISIRLKPFLKIHPSLQRRIIEKCFWKLAIRPTYAHILSLIEFCNSASAGKELHLPDGVRVVKDLQEVCFTRPLASGITRGSTPPLPQYRLTIPQPGVYGLPEINRKIEIQVTGDVSLPDPDGPLLKLDKDHLSFPLEIRGPHPGERFHPYNARGSKKISRYFNDRKIPKKLRSSWPLVISKGRIIALAGLEIDHTFRITESTTQALTISLLIKG